MNLKFTPIGVKGLAIAALAAAGVIFSCSKSPSVETSSPIHVFDGPKASVSVSLRNAAPLTKAELQTAQEKAISSLDVFVFRDGLLEAHGRSTGATVTGLEVTHGEKTIWAFVNYSVERMNAVTSLATATSFATQYAENGRSAFCMRGYDTFTVSSSATSFNMDVRRDVSKVEIAAAPQFTGLAAGGTLEGIYLINIPKVYSNSAVSTSSSDSWNFDNAVATAVDPQVSALSSATGASSWQTALYGMPNTTAEAATVDTKDYVTKLVMKATVQGQSYWYPIGIPDMGANKLYSISNIVIRRIGADNPNDYISAEDIDITINVLDWETGEVDGSYNEGVIPPTFYGKISGVEYADLGIRLNGYKILFATCNLGASKPYEHGDYYSWGEKEVRYESISGNMIEDGNAFDAGNAAYNSGDGSRNWSRYTGILGSYSSSNIADGCLNLDPYDDAVKYSFGDDPYYSGCWRTPKLEDYYELLNGNGLTRQWIENYNSTGVSGYLIYGKGKYSATSIFLPAGGFAEDMEIEEPNSCCFYWSDFLCAEDPDKAYSMQISQEASSIVVKERWLGANVRPVISVPDSDNNPVGQFIRDYVDLGVRWSGDKILFAVCDLGSDEPINEGDRFSWGYTYNDDDLYVTSRLEYKWYDGDDGYIKYMVYDPYGHTGVLLPEDDAVFQEYGGDWRMLDERDILPLINNDDVIMTLNRSNSGYYNLSGIFIVSNAGKTKGNFVFIRCKYDNSTEFFVRNFDGGEVHKIEIYDNGRDNSENVVVCDLVGTDPHGGTYIRPVLVVPE